MLRLDFFIGIVLGLVFQQRPHTVPQLDHAADSALCRLGYLHRVHTAVFTVVDLPVHQCIGEVADSGIGLNGMILALQLLLPVVGGDFAVEILNGLRQQCFQRLLRIRLTGGRGAERPGHHLHLAQDHIRVVDEVAVHLDAVLVGGKVHPFGFYIHHSFPFLQEQNVRHDLRTGGALKGVVGQADGPQQLCSLRDVFSCAGGALVHSVAGGHNGDDAARSDLIQCLGDEILVDGEIQPVIAFVRHMKLAERHIADGYIEKVIREDGLLIALHRNTAFLIKLSGDASGEIVQLHAVELAAAHIFRQHTEEIADAAGRLQDVPLCEAHLPQGGIDAADDHRRRKERRQRGFAGGGVFGVHQQVFQLAVSRVLFIEEVRQTAPAHILCQHRLFLRCGGAVLRLHGFQGTDRVQIALKTLQRRALSDVVIGDAVVAAVRVQRIGKRVLLFLFRLGEYRRRLDRLLCGGVFGALHIEPFRRFLFVDCLSDLLQIILSLPLAGEGLTDALAVNINFVPNIVPDGVAVVRFDHAEPLIGGRLLCGKPCCILCDLLHKAAFLLRSIMPVVEQAESAVHILRKPILCAADGIIETVTLVRPIQPGGQRRQYFRSLALILQLLLDHGNRIVIIRTLGIGTRNIVRRIVKTVVDDSSQLPTLIFRDFGDSVLTGEAFLRNEFLIFLDHIGDGQMDGIIFFESVVSHIFQSLMGLAVIVTRTSATAVLTKLALNEFLAFLRRVRIAEMGVHRQSSINTVS